jgi:hypothetical protein
MPILRRDDGLEARNEPIRHGYRLVPVRNCQCAARTEVVLEIDKNERASHAATVLPARVDSRRHALAVYSCKQVIRPYGLSHWNGLDPKNSDNWFRGR